MPEIFGAALMGGGTGKAFAAIGVTYPAGATCTCSLGSKTLTAPDTSGQALFIVPYAGEWVVTISQSGKQPISQTVNVTESIAYVITLTFDLILYDNGDIPGGILLQGTAWEPGRPNKGSFTLESDHIALQVNNSSICVAPDTAIDVTRYNTLYAKVYSSSSAKGRAYLCLRDSLGIGWNFSSGAADITMPIDKELSLDISEVSGAFYPSIVLYSAAAGVAYSLDVYKFYMK